MLIFEEIALLFAAVACQGDSDAITEEEIKELNQVGTIPVEKAMRCGMFFAKDEVGLPPIETLFVIKATWDAPECPTEDRVERSIEFCSKVWVKVAKKFQFTRPSLTKANAEKGLSIGDDICELLKSKGVIFAGEKSKRYPKGVQIGFFANVCGNKKWEDTGIRHTEPVCCAKGKHVDCP